MQLYRYFVRHSGEFCPITLCVVLYFNVGGEDRHEIDFVLVSSTPAPEAMKTFRGMKIGGDDIKMDGLNSL
jgi:hypothetical protein